MSTDSLSTDFEKIFPVGFEAFNLDRSVLNGGISNLCPLLTALVTLETIVGLVRVLALDNVPHKCHSVVSDLCSPWETHAGRC